MPRPRGRRTSILGDIWHLTKGGPELLNYPCLAQRLSQTTCGGPSQLKLGTGSLKHTLPFMAFPPYSHSSLQLLWKGSCTNSEAYHCKRYTAGREIGQQKGVGDDLDWLRRRESHLKGAEDQLLELSHTSWAGCQEHHTQLSQNDRKGGLSCRWMKVGFQQIPQAPKSLGIHDLACTDVPFVHAPRSCVHRRSAVHQRDTILSFPPPRATGVTKCICSNFL